MTARLLCTRIERGLAELGFNAADSAAGVWAAATSDQFTAEAAELILSPSTCVAMERWAVLNGTTGSYADEAGEDEVIYEYEVEDEAAADY